MDLYTVRNQLSMGMPLSNIKLRVTDYSRVSTEHKEQKKSLKNQVEHFDKMIKQNPNWTYVKGYVDDGITGTSDIKRESFMKMIDDARSGKFDLIITKEISRFSRNTLDSIKYTRELLSYGVAVLFVNDNINTALPDSEPRLTIMASMAQDEVRRLSERVKFGMNRSIEKGEILGNDTLYGYKKDKATGNLLIVEIEAELVKRIYNMYCVDNFSLNKIAKILNEEGHVTCKKNKWCTSTLARMIKNPKYKGYYCGKKTEIIDYMTKKVKYIPEKDWVVYEDKLRIPPIIEEELWERANIRLESRKKRFGEDYKDKSMYKNRYPFSAKIYCSNHNEVFHRRKQCKASDDITWTCALYLREGKSKCDSPNIRESELYSIFDDIIDFLKIKMDNISEMLLELYQTSHKNIGLDNRANEINKAINKCVAKKEKLLELNMDGSLSNTEFCVRSDECNAEIVKLEEALSEIELARKNFSDVEDVNVKLKKILNQKVKTTATKQKLMELLLDKIVVSKIENDKNNLELNIFFNFSRKYFLKEVQQKISPNVDGLKNFMRKEYEFKRGYNTVGTKRYTVKYHVNCYICV